MYSISAIGEIVRTERATWRDRSLEISHLAYDSRKLADARHSLFFALRNVRDGHAFIGDAYGKGVRNFVVSRSEVDGESYPDANFLWVDDALVALQALAAHHRDRFHSLPVWIPVGTDPVARADERYGKGKKRSRFCVEHADKNPEQ